MAKDRNIVCLVMCLCVYINAMAIVQFYYDININDTVFYYYCACNAM